MATSCAQLLMPCLAGVDRGTLNFSSVDPRQWLPAGLEAFFRAVISTKCFGFLCIAPLFLQFLLVFHSIWRKNCLTKDF
jgi:hypothetical protein